MNATSLLARVVDGFKTVGVELEQSTPGDGWYTKYERVQGTKVIGVKETYRHNGTSENVTATIKVSELGGFEARVLYPLCIVKVPKDASTKVIMNRVNKAMEFYKGKESK